MNSIVPSIMPAPATPLPILGALVRVTVLRHKGERVPEAFLPAPLEGRVKFVRADGGQFWRPDHLDLVSNQYSTSASLCIPLFQPHIGAWDESGLTIVGWEINTVDGKKLEYRQAWLVTPA